MTKDRCRDGVRIRPFVRGGVDTDRWQVDVSARLTFSNKRERAVVSSRASLLGRASTAAPVPRWACSSGAVLISTQAASKTAKWGSRSGPGGPPLRRGGTASSADLGMVAESGHL